EGTGCHFAVGAALGDRQRDLELLGCQFRESVRRAGRSALARCAQLVVCLVLPWSGSEAGEGAGRVAKVQSCLDSLSLPAQELTEAQLCACLLERVVGPGEEVQCFAELHLGRLCVGEQSAASL